MATVVKYSVSGWTWCSCLGLFCDKSCLTLYCHQWIQWEKSDVWSFLMEYFVCYFKIIFSFALFAALSIMLSFIEWPTRHQWSHDIIITSRTEFSGSHPGHIKTDNGDSLHTPKLPSQAILIFFINFIIYIRTASGTLKPSGCYYFY